jgi:hypothetical protein
VTKGYHFNLVVIADFLILPLPTLGFLKWSWVNTCTVILGTSHSSFTSFLRINHTGWSWGGPRCSNTWIKACAMVEEIVILNISFWGDLLSLLKLSFYFIHYIFKNWQKKTI